MVPEIIPTRITSARLGFPLVPVLRYFFSTYLAGVLSDLRKSENVTSAGCMLTIGQSGASMSHESDSFTKIKPSSEREGSTRGPDAYIASATSIVVVVCAKYK